MSRLPLVDPATATGPAKNLLDAVGKKLGIVPNMTRALANSPAALKAYLDLSGALAGASLDAKTRERIALAVGEVNGCDYCVAAHSTIGGKLGLTREELLDARLGTADTPKTRAVLRFARNLVLQRGLATDGDLVDVRAAGVTDGEIAEIVAVTALNVFTNWFNHVADTPIDFPAAEPLPAEACTTTGCSTKPAAACGCSG